MSFTHRCQFNHKSDYRNFQSPKSAKTFKCSKFFENLISIDSRHPKCKQFLISNAAVAKEKRVQSLLPHRWIVHPFSITRFIWEIIMMITYLVAFVTIPFMICCVVLDYEKTRMDNVNLFIYGICWIDIIFNSLTGYYSDEDNEFVMDQRKILKRYLKRYFILDVLTSLPYDRITFNWRSVPGPNSSLVINLVNLIPLLKMSRYFTLNAYIFQFFTYFDFQYFTYQMFSMLLLYVYVFFWFACFCYVVPILVMHAFKVTAEECKDCFFVQARMSGIGERFKQAVFIVLENFTASSYGTVVPETPGHIMLCTIFMILGRLFDCYIIITFLKISSSRNAPVTKYQEIIDHVNAYAQQKQFPTHIKRRLISFYHHRYNDSYFNESEILSNLSEKLRKELVLHSCRRLVENVSIFRDLAKDVVASILLVLKPEFYLPDDVIMKAGVQGDCMYFLDAGTVAVYTPQGREICHFEDGAFFGEVALLVQDQRRIATIVAVTVCEVYRLDRKDFRKYVSVHKELMKKIERAATTRMEQTILIDEKTKTTT